MWRLKSRSTSRNCEAAGIHRASTIDVDVLMACSSPAARFFSHRAITQRFAPNRVEEGDKVAAWWRVYILSA